MNLVLLFRLTKILTIRREVNDDSDYNWSLFSMGPTMLLNLF